MFNNSKSEEFFDPYTLRGPVQIIGCGAVGAAVAELLSRLGLSEITIWDEDVVAPHNLGNQLFRNKDIGKPKTDALEDILKEINPDINVIKKGYIKASDKPEGYIFMCIDNIDVRRELCTKWKFNSKIIMLIDGRMGLTTGNVYAAEWSNLTEKKNLLASMQFTHEEVLAETPVSACGLTLSVVCTPRIIASLMVSNLIKYINTGKYLRMITADGYAPFLDAYEVDTHVHDNLQTNLH